MVQVRFNRPMAWGKPIPQNVDLGANIEAVISTPRKQSGGLGFLALVQNQKTDRFGDDATANLQTSFLPGSSLPQCGGPVMANAFRPMSRACSISSDGG